MILVFGGTTEGRLAADVLEEAGKPFFYSTKGTMQELTLHHGVRLTGAMDAAQMTAFCRENDIRCIIDAAHPFAAGLHSTIAAVGVPVVRLQRAVSEPREGVIYCRDFDDAVAKLLTPPIPRKLLALTGVNTISRLKPFWQSHPTLFRILPRSESIAQAESQGFPRENLLFYDSATVAASPLGGTGKEDCDCDAIITKDSGESGGFSAKVDAALSRGMRVLVVKALDYASFFAEVQTPLDIVTGRYGLRRAVERIVPGFFPLRTGFTTGACATAAAKASLLHLLTGESPESVCFALPDGEVMSIDVTDEGHGVFSAKKDFSDDPDVTRGCKIRAQVRPGVEGIRFLQGDGVGTVTLPGLGIPVGEPAVNPTPRRMIEEEFRALSDAPYDVTISVDGGAELALHTFNLRVGVLGGISIIGTSGIVRPLSHEAFVQSLRREIGVARAIGCEEIALVSGMNGEQAVRRQRDIRCIHYGNDVGEALQAAHDEGVPRVLLAIMIGKAVKLAEGHLNTHSHRVTMNRAFLTSLAPEYADRIEKITLARELWDFMPDSFFEQIRVLCYEHCRKVFPSGDLIIQIIR